ALKRPGRRSAARAPARKIRGRCLNMRKFRDLAALILVASFILTACGAPSTDSTQGGYVSGDGQITVVPPDEREPAPAIKGETVDGKDVTIDDWRDRKSTRLNS